MFRFLTALALILVSQGPGPSVTGAANNTSACVLPAFTNADYAYNPGILCGAPTGSACSNGNGTYSIPDAIAGGGNGLAQPSTLIQPVYTTGVVNGQPALTFNGTTDAMDLLPNINPASGSIRMFAVVSPASGAFQPILGSSNTLIANHVFTWAVTPTGQQVVYISQIGNIGVGSDTLSSTGPNAIVVDYNFSTKAGQFYVCSGGTCSTDGSPFTGGATVPNHNSESIGADGPDATYYSGWIAEFDPDTTQTVSLTSIGTYALCKYGI